MCILYYFSCLWITGLSIFMLGFFLQGALSAVIGCEFIADFSPEQLAWPSAWVAPMAAPAEQGPRGTHLGICAFWSKRLTLATPIFLCGSLVQSEALGSGGLLAVDGEAPNPNVCCVACLLLARTIFITCRDLFVNSKVSLNVGCGAL